MTALSLKKAGLLFLIAACLAPLGDYGHVSTETTAYHWNQKPHIILSPWWFVLVVALFASFLGEVTCRLKPYLKGNIKNSKLMRMWMGLGGVLAVYAATALLPKEHVEVEAFLMSSLAFLIWAFADGTLLGFLIGLLAAFGATGSEILLVRLGAFHYHEKINSLFGVAPWLPAIHFTFGVSVVRVEAFLDAKLRN